MHFLIDLFPELTMVTCIYQSLAATWRWFDESSFWIRECSDPSQPPRVKVETVYTNEIHKYKVYKYVYVSTYTNVTLKIRYDCLYLVT